MGQWAVCKAPWQKPLKLNLFGKAFPHGRKDGMKLTPSSNEPSVHCLNDFRTSCLFNAYMDFYFLPSFLCSEWVYLTAELVVAYDGTLNIEAGPQKVEARCAAL